MWLRGTSTQPTSLAIYIQSSKFSTKQGNSSWGTFATLVHVNIEFVGPNLNSFQGNIFWYVLMDFVDLFKNCYFSVSLHYNLWKSSIFLWIDYASCSSRLSPGPEPAPPLPGAWCGYWPMQSSSSVSCEFSSWMTASIWPNSCAAGQKERDAARQTRWNVNQGTQNSM